MTEHAPNYLWLDLETTGSDETMHHIIEVGVAVTDPGLNIMDEGSWPVQPPTYDHMEDVVVRMHLDNGLLVHSMGGYPLGAVEDEVLGTIQPHLRGGRIILAGSGVGHFDRRFIRAQMPKLDKRLSFAPLDVGQVRRFLTLAGVVERPAVDPKKHRSLDDVHAHLAEARKYLAVFSTLEVPSS